MSTYTFKRTQTVTIRMCDEGEEWEGEPVHYTDDYTQKDAALEWAHQTFLDEDYCEDFMEAETSEWELVNEY